MPHPALTWLVVMEAHWQRTLDDKEFAFGHMLHELFARVPWAQVRHRFYSDEASLVRWCRQLMYLPEPAGLDGIFHSATYLFVVAGLFALWRSAQRRHLFWSTKLLAGTMLLGFGLFNTAEGLINHHVLGIHRVNETAARESWVYWDIAFTLSGLLMLAAGWLLVRQGEHETAVAASDKRGRNGPGK